MWSDVVCPWCAIGARRFAAGVEMFAAAGGDASSIVVRRRPFQLDPDAPPDPTPVAEVYARKFGGPERAAQIFGQVTSAAAESGLDFHLERAVRANTFDAHRLIWLAASSGEVGFDGVAEERLMAAYFSEGRNIADPDVLLACGVDIGLDPARVASMLAGDEGRSEVRADIELGVDRGITAVPSFVFAGEFVISGAQEPALFARILGKLTAS